MKVLDEGHTYTLQNNKSDKCDVTLSFFKDRVINGDGYEGTTNQEVLRALIDRVKFLDKQVPHKNNQEILYHLRKAIVLHEQRHLDRLLEKGVEVENLEIFSDSHIVRLKD